MPSSESSSNFKAMNLSGWGRYKRFDCRVLRCEKMSEFEKAANISNGSTLIARGYGRSYGDAAINDSGYTVLSERLDRILAFDEETGTMTAQPGISLASLLEVFVPRGWMIPVVPGTKFISLGGAVAADIHGKNHHREGSFSKHLMSFKLTDGLGHTHHCSRQSNPDFFWATIGGMGLTGLISDVQVQLQRIPSSFIDMKIVAARNLAELIDSFTQYEDKHQFSVAWVDCLAKGQSLGRGILMLGDFASGHSYAWSPKAPLPVPIEAPDILLNQFSMGMFNELYYRLPRPELQVVDADRFFFPLDRISNWNCMYGPRGFIQYQCLLPPGPEGAKGLERIFKTCQDENLPSFFAVLKRFAKAEQNQFATLSFPDEGYTLAIDLPGDKKLARLCTKLDQIVVEYGGRIYLAKDSMMTAETFAAMYPQAVAWQKVCTKLHSERVFRSALAKRLGLRD